MAESKTCEQLRAALESLATGDFDALAPEIIIDAEAHLNSCAACAARLAERAAIDESPLMAEVPLPSESAWNRVWIAAEDASAPAWTHRMRMGFFRHARAWSAVAAAAVLLIAFGIWRSVTPHAPTLPTFQLARGDDVRIESIEVFGDEMPMVISTDGDEGLSIIWVVEKES
jgi:anti-sigma factor RsiW